MLAGREDIKRFFDAVEVRRRFFEMNRHKFMFAQGFCAGCCRYRKSTGMAPSAKDRSSPRRC